MRIKIQQQVAISLLGLVLTWALAAPAATKPLSHYCENALAIMDSELNAQYSLLHPE